MTANYRANIVAALQKLHKKYSTEKEADTVFLDRKTRVNRVFTTKI